jgi:hypothetical protein
LLSSPALTTLVGRLLFPAGDPAPPGPVEAGLLSSLTRLLIKSSSFFRSWSDLPGVGDASYGRLAKLPKKDEGLYIRSAPYALPACRNLSGPKLPLPLELRKLGLLRQDLIFTCLHTSHDCPCLVCSRQMIRTRSRWCNT